MPPVIPDWISDRIQKDNRAYLADLQVFNPLFFNFATELLKHCNVEIVHKEDELGAEARP